MDDGQPQWPEFWKLDQLEAVKASLPVGKWNAQWQQEPTSEETSIIKPRVVATVGETATNASAIYYSKL
jgi:hypothetical protein